MKMNVTIPNLHAAAHSLQDLAVSTDDLALCCSSA